MDDWGSGGLLKDLKGGRANVRKSPGKGCWTALRSILITTHSEWLPLISNNSGWRAERRTWRPRQEINAAVEFMLVGFGLFVAPLNFFFVFLSGEEVRGSTSSQWERASHLHLQPSWKPATVMFSLCVRVCMCVCACECSVQSEVN